MHFPLVAFDIDGTLVRPRPGTAAKVVWRLLNDHFIGDGVVGRSRLEAYLAGDLTYEQWVALDVGGWQRAGATRDEMARLIREALVVGPGVRETLAALRARGHHLVAISGTIDLLVDVLLPEQPFERCHTTRIEFGARGCITGWQATPFDMEGKVAALLQAARALGVSLERCAFVGDDINDIAAMSAVGLAVAYEPKHPEVGHAATYVIDGDLRQLLPLLARPARLAREVLA